MNETAEREPQAASPLLRYASNIVAAFVQKNHIAIAGLPEAIQGIHRALAGLGSPSTDEAVENRKPAVSVKRSITPDYIVCLEDGKRLKMLKRYIRTRFNLTPDEYRAKWRLPRDYPMVAPNYSERRSQFAKKIGLGRGAKVEKKAAPGKHKRGKKTGAGAGAG